MIVRARQWLGVAMREWPAYREALARADRGYLALCNRGETLEPAPGGNEGFRCNWQWTSDLHAPKLMPQLGRVLLRRSLADHPIVPADAPLARGAPEVSFIIGHRGDARLPHLLATLRSIAGQRDARVECIVVEQDTTPRAQPHLPPWVRHLHAPPPRDDLPYCRSWAFNIGVRAAAAPLLVLHDNDMLVPANYAATALRVAASGFEAMNLKRFVFYLSQHATTRLLAGGDAWREEAPEAIVQNLEAGGSVAITRDAYGRIGGMDEAFVGWGGEDNEFWDRCQALRVWPWASLPIVHCWHAPQPKKGTAQRETHALLQARSAVPVDERIARLKRLPSGELAGPQGVA